MEGSNKMSNHGDDTDGQNYDGDNDGDDFVGHPKEMYGGVQQGVQA